MSNNIPPRQITGTDHYQTPMGVFDPVISYVPKHYRIWEPACGQGNLVNDFTSKGYDVIGTDILYGNDFFSYEPNEWDILITNPPFSIKDKWIKRCYDLDKPWILLLPLTALEGQFRQKLYREKGVNIMFFDKRINYINDNAKTGSPFASVILSWKVDIGGQFIFI